MKASPWAIARTPRGRTLGFDSTAGYFGIDGGSIKLPGRIEVNYPIGAACLLMSFDTPQPLLASWNKAWM